MNRMLLAGLLILVLGATALSLGRNSRPDETAEPVPNVAVTTGAVLYDPVKAREPLPDGFRQLIPRDGIPPVYEPAYVLAAAAPWPDETLVVGVALGDEARAYPVSYLNRREMVIDSLAGIPVLVTW